MNVNQPSNRDRVSIQTSTVNSQILWQRGQDNANTEDEPRLLQASLSCWASNTLTASTTFSTLDSCQVGRFSNPLSQTSAIFQDLSTACHFPYVSGTLHQKTPPFSFIPRLLPPSPAPTSPHQAMAVAALAWLNAALFAAQLYVNGYSSRNIAPMSRKHETLITPAPYAFSIWGFIYSLLAVAVVVDCACSSLSLFADVPHASLLRALFAVACLMNVAWVVFFTHEWLHAASCSLLVLWLALLALYLHVLAIRRDQGFSFGRYLCSELGITVYFAWTCAALLISICVSLQEFAGGYLSLTAYLSALSLLSVAAISALVYAEDFAFAMVAIWALRAIAVKQLDLTPAVERVSLSVRTSATQSAAIIGAFIIVALVAKFVPRES